MKRKHPSDSGLDHIKIIYIKELKNNSFNHHLHESKRNIQACFAFMLIFLKRIILMSDLQDISI